VKSVQSALSTSADWTAYYNSPNPEEGHDARCFCCATHVVASFASRHPTLIRPQTQAVFPSICKFHHLGWAFRYRFSFVLLRGRLKSRVMDVQWVGHLDPRGGMCCLRRAQGQGVRKRKHEGEKSRFIWVTVMEVGSYMIRICVPHGRTACLPEDEGSRFGSVSRRAK
jgi:hypothetical protein